MDVARVVVIATSEVDRESLAEVVEPDDELVVLVPAVEQSRLEWLANDEDAARGRAREVAHEVDRAAPTDASAVEVKPDRPTQLVTDAIGTYRPDRVVLALREGERSTWLEEGELEAVPDRVAGTPVVRMTL